MGSFSQEYPVNAWVPEGFILGSVLFLTLPDDAICYILIYTDDTTLYSKCDQASDLWQQLGWAFEIESDLQDFVDSGRKWFVDFSFEKTQLVLFDWSKNIGATDEKMDGSVLEEKSAFKIGVDFLF